MRALIVCVLLVGLAHFGSAQTEKDKPQNPPPPPRPAAWKGPPVRFVGGLNLGLQKIFVRVSANEPDPALLDVEFRKTGDFDAIAREEFSPLNAPAGMVFLGATDVDSSGNKWCQLKWQTLSGQRKYIVATDLKSVAKTHLDYLQRNNYDISPEKMPYGLLIVEDEGQKAPLVFPLRDLAAFADPKRALLDDVIVMEKGANLTAVAQYFLGRANRSFGEDAARWVIRFGALPTDVIRDAEVIVLGMREAADKDLAAAAARVCKMHGFISLQEIEQAVADLVSSDETVLRRAALFLRDAGPRARREAFDPMKKILERTDVSDEIKSIAKVTVERLEKIDPKTLKPYGDKGSTSQPSPESRPSNNG